MTIQEIIKELEKQEISVEEFGECDIKNPLPVIGAWEEVDQEGGGEGQGEYVHSVKLFKEHGVYIKTVGFYTSYHGTDWENGYGEEVKPLEKTITVYE
jgi:hypothetical protein